MTALPQWLKDWLKEAWHRFKMERPLFFKVMDRIVSLLVLIPGLPYVLRQIEQILLEFGVEYSFPAFLTILSNKFAVGLGIGAKIGTWFAVKSTPVAQTEEGQAVTVLDKEKMPFTTKSEARDVALAEPPLKVAEEVPEPQEIPKRE